MTGCCCLHASEENPAASSKAQVWVPVVSVLSFRFSFSSWCSDSSRSSKHFSCFAQVDTFQGREDDVIIVSLVRTNHLGFLASSNRVNVMLTRYVCVLSFAKLKRVQRKVVQVMCCHEVELCSDTCCYERANGSIVLHLAVSACLCRGYLGPAASANTCFWKCRLDVCCTTTTLSNCEARMAVVFSMAGMLRTSVGLMLHACHAHINHAFCR